MQQQNSWLESRGGKCHKELERQGLDQFAEQLFAFKKMPGSEQARLADIGELLISLGLCPSLDFIFKVPMIRMKTRSWPGSC